MADAPDGVCELVARAARFLPAQGPITAFVHHNTLHAFEHLPFERAVEEASALYGCQPYLSEERYRSELGHGRIRTSDLEAVLREDLGPRAVDTVAGLVRRGDLRRTMLVDPVRLAPEAELRWVVAAGGGLRAFRSRCPPLIREQVVADTRQWVMRELRGDRAADAALRAMAADVLARRGERRIEHWSRGDWEEITLTLLWRICRAGLHGPPRHRPAHVPPPRLREPLLAASGVDSDELVHEVLVRFCSVFADQGLAAWSLPRREEGFYRAFLGLYGDGWAVRPDWMDALPEEIARLEREGRTAQQCVEESLAALGVTSTERADFVTHSLLALRGWAGMLWQLESRPDRVRHAAPPGTLVDFLAVRLLLDRLASAHVARAVLGSSAPLDELRRTLRERAAPRALATTQLAYVIFLLAQSLGWPPRRLASLSREQWEELATEVDGFPELERRRLFQRAYERRYRVQALDALAAHRPPVCGADGVRPALQVVTCIDEREESFRRHVEEVEPEVETFGAAGFFGVAMSYRGVSDAEERPLCPVAIRPVHRVREVVRPEHGLDHARGASRTRRIGAATFGVHAGSRGLVAGLATTIVGAVAAAPLVARVLFPRLAARLGRRAERLVRSPVDTELALERQPSADGGAAADEVVDGFLPEEMAAIVERVLREVGLTRSFARLVVVVGHGSSSLNNPHEAAYDCGACGGGRGDPNARAFAHMANLPAVRSALAASGIAVPGDTVFLGAYHDTCDDSLTFHDTYRLPPTHEGDLRRARAILESACERNAHERCRRFRSASLSISPAEARRHVEARAEDLAQPRPECGHATNALCVVGRRARTRGLFMDRRAFLVSYDPAADDGEESSPVLERILAAVLPVCAGINLEYYFSYVDPRGWGCGTKLPHNVASLLGVMDGAASDLRPGLPWQMVEIHEPVRLSLVVESTPAKLARAFERTPSIARLCANEWLWLATLDPDSPLLHVLEEGVFRPYEPESPHLPAVESSAHWYGGLREHLDFAAVGLALPRRGQGGRP